MPSTIAPSLVAMAPLVAVSRDAEDFATLVERLRRTFQGASREQVKAYFEANDPEACEAVVVSMLTGARPSESEREEGTGDRYLDVLPAILLAACAILGAPSHWLVGGLTGKVVELLDAAKIDDALQAAILGVATQLFELIGISEEDIKANTQMPSLVRHQQHVKDTQTILDAGFDHSKLIGR